MSGEVILGQSNGAGSKKEDFSDWAIVRTQMGRFLGRVVLPEKLGLRTLGRDDQEDSRHDYLRNEVIILEEPYEYSVGTDTRGNFLASAVPFELCHSNGEEDGRKKSQITIDALPRLVTFFSDLEPDDRDAYVQLVELGRKQARQMKVALRAARAGVSLSSTVPRG